MALMALNLKISDFNGGEPEKKAALTALNWRNCGVNGGELEK